MHNSNTKIPTLSVVVPVRNGIKFINETLDSLSHISTLIECEVIFQDCLSDDGTSELLSAFCTKSPLFHHHREEDSGQSDAINSGALKAKGRWVTWLCADDVLLGGVVTSLELAEESGAELVYGDVLFVMEQSVSPAFGTEKYREGILSQKKLIIQQPGTCILRSTWEELSGVEEKLNWTMDYDLFLRMETRKKKFLRCREFVAIIRIHPEAKTSSGSFARFREVIGVIYDSHKRVPSWFRPRPYIIYFVEYLIKAFEESMKNSLPSLPFRILKKILHAIFWLFARSPEKEDIQYRFTGLHESDRNVLDRLLKQ